MSLVVWANSLLVAAGMSALLVARRARRPVLAVRAVTGAFVGMNGLTALACGAMFLGLLGAPQPVAAQSTQAAAGLGGAALGAALATGLACIGAGIAVGIAGAAAIGGITEKPEILGRTLIFVGLAEGIAIYGLIISFMILSS